MNRIKCPTCKRPTRQTYDEDTVLEKCPLYCHKCGKCHKIDFHDGEIQKVYPAEAV